MSGLYFAIPAQANAAGLARDALRQLRDVADELLDDLALLTSEVVTNSLVHAGLSDHDEVKVCVERRPDHVSVRVCDPGRSTFAPARREGRDDGSGGWGLFIVDQLAERWGVERNDHTCVWFELAL